MPARPTYEQIERRAYELWEKRGRPEGYDSEFWAKAERQLMLELARSGTSLNSDAPDEAEPHGPYRPYDRIRR